MPPDTVLTITVHPKPVPRLSDLRLDLSKFKKEQTGHIEKLVSYVSKEDGLSIEVDEERNIVLALEYSPAETDTRLRCP